MAASRGGGAAWVRSASRTTGNDARSAWKTRHRTSRQSRVIQCHSLQRVVRPGKQTSGRVQMNRVVPPQRTRSSCYASVAHRQGFLRGKPFSPFSSVTGKESEVHRRGAVTCNRNAWTAASSYSYLSELDYMVLSVRYFAPCRAMTCVRRTRRCAIVITPGVKLINYHEMMIS